MPKKINRLAVQFAQDGHLSISQKWRSLAMKAFGHEGLIRADALVLNGHCPMLDTDTYRFAPTKWRKYTAWRKLLNPFKWLEFILSLLEFLPWFFHRLPWAMTPLMDSCHKKNPRTWYLLSFLGYLSIFLAALLHLAVQLVLSIIMPILAPARHIIRPSIQLAKANPAVFIVLLGITSAPLGYLAWLILTGKLSLAIGSLVLTSTLAAQIAVVILAGILLWTVLLKFQTVISQFIDIKRKHPKNQQTVVFYPNPEKTWTNTPAIILHRLSPNTEAKKPEEQDVSYKIALILGIEQLFYPAPKKEDKGEAGDADFVEIGFDRYRLVMKDYPSFKDRNPIFKVLAKNPNLASIEALEAGRDLGY